MALPGGKVLFGIETVKVIPNHPHVLSLADVN
jgi:hypothetical protein